jgi:hypothetical protein
MYEGDELGGSGGCPYESPMYESPIHKRTPRAGSIAVARKLLDVVEKRWKLLDAVRNVYSARPI